MDKLKKESKPSDNKWENIEKEIENEEKVEEIENKDFNKESSEMVHKMMGCSRDHASEIDIYNKPYPEKIARIKMMKEEGNKAIQEYSNLMKTEGATTETTKTSEIPSSKIA